MCFSTKCVIEMGIGMTRTLYEKYGGFSQINRVVMDFYDNLLDNDEVGPYFDDVDMPRLIDHQTKFLAYLLGGPANFADDHLERAHASLNITPGHFDEMKTILSDTLQEAGFSSDDLGTVMRAIEAHRDQVVSYTHVP